MATILVKPNSKFKISLILNFNYLLPSLPTIKHLKMGSLSHSNRRIIQILNKDKKILDKGQLNYNNMHLSGKVEINSQLLRI